MNRAHFLYCLGLMLGIGSCNTTEVKIDYFGSEPIGHEVWVEYELVDKPEGFMLRLKLLSDAEAKPAPTHLCHRSALAILSDLSRCRGKNIGPLTVKKIEVAPPGPHESEIACTASVQVSYSP